IPDAPFPVSFEAIVASSNGETLFREFGPLLATGMPSAQPLGPHYPVAATTSPTGDLVLLRIVPSADGNWNVSIPGTVDPSMPSVSYVTTLGAGYGRDDPGQMSAGCSASWCVGQVPDSVAAIRATLEDGRVVFGTLGTPPQGIEFGG